MPTDPEYALYRLLYREIESYLHHLLQIRRDYRREQSGIEILFAMDYSELHDYMDQTQNRSEVNAYVVDESHATFTLLPSAVGELIGGIQKDLKRSSLPAFGEALYRYPEVAQFVSSYPATASDPQALINLYAAAETRLREAMGHLCHAAVGGEGASGVGRLQDLLDKKRIRPVTGIASLGRVTAEMRRMQSLVQFHLDISRPRRGDNNMADASDLTVARMLCEQGVREVPKYVPIYTQSTDLLSASTAHESLLFDDDPLVRDIKYFQYRTKLHTAIRTTSKRLERLDQLVEICERAKVHLGEVVRGPEHEEFWKSHAGAKAADTAREFDEEVRRPLYFRIPSAEALDQVEHQAERLYERLRQEGEFASRIDEAHDVLRTQFSRIQDTLQAFVPSDLDPGNVQQYKKKLQCWLAGAPVTPKG
jgi:hypothetical protein